MKLTGRKAHMLFVQFALKFQARFGHLPESRNIARFAGVHPSTAQRWLADLRAVLPASVTAFRLGLPR
jgi:hypothetical protein